MGVYYPPPFVYDLVSLFHKAMSFFNTEPDLHARSAGRTCTERNNVHSLNTYAPPPGPPPANKPSLAAHEMANPPANEPPPYHDWTSIPDTSLLPPPPSIGHERGSSSNADTVSADRAHEWCRTNRLVLPHRPTPDQYAAINDGDVRLVVPLEYQGNLSRKGIGRWQGSTRVGSKDACLLSSAPLFFALADSPIHTSQRKTVYFEIEIKSLGRSGKTDECSIAIGYCCLPYPTFRMPGWERGSLAVHSDDGRRYINDTWGGKDFTSPFKKGDVIGLGMTFSVPRNPPEYGAQAKGRAKPEIEVFLTRNGEKDSAWDLFEQLDKDTDQPIDGLEGLFDLYAAV